VNELGLKMETLPEAAKNEMRILYEYLVFKYMRTKSSSTGEVNETNKHLTAFRRFKKLRDHMNPVVDKSIDIDQLINEGNRDIF
jgi:hypothetical protein